MIEFIKTSIGKKFIMSITGLFLVLFLTVHLLLNSFLLIPDDGKIFNEGAHFMATNRIVKIIEPLLAVTFVIHIWMGTIITIKNRQARGKQRYASGNKTKNISWASKNMFLLGIIIIAFLLFHLYHFFLKIKFTGSEIINQITIDIAGLPTKVENTYSLVNFTFSKLWLVTTYIAASLSLGLHISHGLWSGFQSVGLSNTIWQNRLKKISIIIAIIVGIGFATISVVQYIRV